MQYRFLGRSGLQVSTIGIGANQFGGPVDAAGTAAILDACLESGINTIDTADSYGRGVSEQYIGPAIKAKRDEWVLMTKFYSPLAEGPNRSGSSRGYIRKAVEASLKRLGTDYIDVYQAHRWDPNTPIEETMSALNDLVKAGMVRYIGCSNYNGWQMAEANLIAQQHGWVPFISSQPQYNLMSRGIEAEHIPACLRFGLGLIPFSPLAGGFLTGKHKRGQGALPGTRMERNPRAGTTVLTDANFDRLEAWEQVAEQAGITMTQLAIGWITAQPVVSTVIIGATSPEQVRENAAIGDMNLSADVLAAIAEADKAGNA